MTQRPEVSRVVLALDAITHQPGSALEAAGDLAARLSAELCGLFVEDLDLLRTAEPFAATIDLLTGRPLVADVPALERTLRALAQSAEQELASLAARQQLRWSFRTVRGRRRDAVASEAHGSDLVVWPEERARLAGRLLPPPADLRVPSWSLLLLRSERRPVPPVLVGWDGTAAAARALAMARALTGDVDGAVTVVPLAATPGRAEELLRDLDRRFDGRGPVRTKPIPPLRLDLVVDLARTLGCGLVVLPDAGFGVESGALPCSLLLVR